MQARQETDDEIVRERVSIGNGGFCKRMMEGCRKMQEDGGLMMIIRWDGGMDRIG